MRATRSMLFEANVHQTSRQPSTASSAPTVFYTSVALSKLLRSGRLKRSLQASEIHLDPNVNY